MKVQEVNATHIGQALTVTSPDMEFKGVLASVRHDAELIEETPLGGATDYSIGRRLTILKFTNGDTLNFKDEAYAFPEPMVRSGGEGPHGTA